MSLTANQAPGPPSVAESTKYSVSTDRRPLECAPRATVVTSPPWAKDEPESPEFDDFHFGGSERSPRPSGTSTTRVPSIVSERPSISTETLGGHYRWNFALPRSRPRLKRHRSSESSSSETTKGSSSRQKRPQPGPSRTSRPRWTNPRKRIYPDLAHGSSHQKAHLPGTSRSESLRLELLLPTPRTPFTLHHNKTPGWDSPWTPRVPEQVYADIRGLDPETQAGAPPRWPYGNETARAKEAAEPDQNGLSPWYRRKKLLRSFFLHNNHIPLVSRILNITFTTVALALAIRIRIIEQDHHLRGAVGSSPVLAVIFAPLTLVHAMVAIYLEYFGRPLGLWRTSAKLAHTLSEVVFICAWSAELALCFDNYFTSPLNCAPQSAVRWYSELPPASIAPSNNVTGSMKRDARTLCAYQLDLVGVVMVALLLYVTNLVISLFRIFEKVKVHQGWGYGR